MSDIPRNLQLTKNFILAEFLRNEDPVPPADIVDNIKNLAMKLQKYVRDRFNRRVIITSGYRTWQHHLEIYHAMGIYDLARIPKKSTHLEGKGADFQVEGMEPTEVQKELDATWPGGMEYCKDHTHCDDRPEKERFYAP